MTRLQENTESRGEVTEPLREAVIEALRGIHDPEIPVNIYDLGLVDNFV